MDFTLNKVKIISIYSSGESHIWLVHTITCSLIYTMYIHKAHRRVSRLVFCSSCFSSSEPVSIYHSMAKQRNNISTDLFPTSALFKTFIFFSKRFFRSFRWSDLVFSHHIGWDFPSVELSLYLHHSESHQQSFNKVFNRVISKVSTICVIYIHQDPQFWRPA